MALLAPFPLLDCSSSHRTNFPFGYSNTHLQLQHKLFLFCFSVLLFSLFPFVRTRQRNVWVKNAVFSHNQVLKQHFFPHVITFRINTHIRLGELLVKHIRSICGALIPEKKNLLIFLLFCLSRRENCLETAVGRTLDRCCEFLPMIVILLCAKWKYRTQMSNLTTDCDKKGFLVMQVQCWMYFISSSFPAYWKKFHT